MAEQNQAAFQEPQYPWTTTAAVGGWVDAARRGQPGCVLAAFTRQPLEQIQMIMTVAQLDHTARHITEAAIAWLEANAPITRTLTFSASEADPNNPEVDRPVGGYRAAGTLCIAGRIGYLTLRDHFGIFVYKFAADGPLCEETLRNQEPRAVSLTQGRHMNTLNLEQQPARPVPVVPDVPEVVPAEPEAPEVVEPEEPENAGPRIDNAAVAEAQAQQMERRAQAILAGDNNQLDRAILGVFSGANGRPLEKIQVYQAMARVDRKVGRAAIDCSIGRLFEAGLITRDRKAINDAGRQFLRDNAPAEPAIDEPGP